MVATTKAKDTKNKTSGVSPPQGTAKKSATKTAKREIDDLFQQASTKRQKAVVEKGTAVAATSKALPPQAKPAGNKEDLFGTGPSKVRRRDEEGLPIYTPDELNVGKGGSTGDCPFDCDCCF